jgi:mono/diheme cytochrome c family protein
VGALPAGWNRAGLSNGGVELFARLSSPAIYARLDRSPENLNRPRPDSEIRDLTGWRATIIRSMKTLVTFLGAATVMSNALLIYAQSNWQIPAAAKTEKSSVKATPEVVKKGRAIFTTRCQKCHGASGVGDGPDADPKNKPANLVASKPEDNPDGVLFYKVFNGQPPKMPAFKGVMSRDEIWTVVEYVKSIRQ